MTDAFQYLTYVGLPTEAYRFGGHTAKEKYMAHSCHEKNCVQEVEVIMIRELVIIHRRHTNVLFAYYTFSILTGALKIQNLKTKNH
jgi:hypothetical protein